MTSIVKYGVMIFILIIIVVAFFYLKNPANSTSKISISNKSAIVNMNITNAPANSIYCIANNTTAVIYAPVSPSGIGMWIKTNSYDPVTYRNYCTSYNSTLYCLNTYSNTTNYATIQPNGNLSAWQNGSAFPLSTYQCTSYNGYIYCIGHGNIVPPYNSTYYAQLTKNGIGTWKQTTSFPSFPLNSYHSPYSQGIYFISSCSAYNNSIYCIAFGPSLNISEGVYVAYAHISNTGISAWNASQINSSYETVLADQCFTYNNYIYCPGRNESIYASLSNITKWKVTTGVFPNSGPLGSLACMAKNGYMYCIYSYLNEPNNTYIPGTKYVEMASYANISQQGIGKVYSTSAPISPSYNTCVIK